MHPQQFHRCLRRYPMTRTSRSLSGWDHFLAMAFAQLTYRESLRHIEACLGRCVHLPAMGIRGRVTRTNLAYANEHRHWRVFADLAQILIAKARTLYAEESFAGQLEQMVYAVDSSSIDLCLSLYPWAHYQRTKGALKLHVMAALQGPTIPVVVGLSDGKVHDVHFLDALPLEPSSIYLFDRAYLHYDRLYRLQQAGVFFILPAKSNMRFRVLEDHPCQPQSGVLSDQSVRLSLPKARAGYPQPLRRLHFLDTLSGKSIVLLTNHFHLPATTLAALYRGRWRIELFFKWIKQNLRIKTFYGYSSNAVHSQIWIAISTYLMVAILNKTLALNQSLARILQVLSVHPFQKTPIPQLFTKRPYSEDKVQIHNQLNFNDLLTGQQ